MFKRSKKTTEIKERVPKTVKLVEKSNSKKIIKYNPYSVEIELINGELINKKFEVKLPETKEYIAPKVKDTLYNFYVKCFQGYSLAIDYDRSDEELIVNDITGLSKITNHISNEEAKSRAESFAKSLFTEYTLDFLILGPSDQSIQVGEYTYPKGSILRYRIVELPEESMEYTEFTYNIEVE